MVAQVCAKNNFLLTCYITR